jgi:hypothetical protein
MLITFTMHSTAIKSLLTPLTEFLHRVYFLTSPTFLSALNICAQLPAHNHWWVIMPVLRELNMCRCLCRSLNTFLFKLIIVINQGQAVYEGTNYMIDYLYS